MNVTQVHLICNAHLDPVWLWRWEDGAAEAISTFRTAVELCEEKMAFVFNHNEAILYRWIQDYDPVLFGRIRRQVKRGRWHIMGGWYLQPDCNMPCGESFVRQILRGREYFREHFGVEPRTAINFDSFGHSRGLVQILAKAGYDSYLFGRPEPAYLDLPEEQFVWKGFDGSQVMASRIWGWYNTPLGQAAETVRQRIDGREGVAVLTVLWGVGDHGGGPSRSDLEQINGLIDSSRDCRIVHSTPERYFCNLVERGVDMPPVERDLNPWAVGCYSSQIRIKQEHRRLENDLFTLEKICSAAWLNGLMPYPAQEIRASLEDLLFAQFHDILCGSSIEPVEEDALRLLAHGRENASRLKARAFFALCCGQPRPAQGEVPILVFNPHPFPIEEILEYEINLPDVRPRDSESLMRIEVQQNGSPVPCQTERETGNHTCEWRKRVVFRARLAAGRMNRFDCRFVKAALGETKAVERGLHFRSADLEVAINPATGLVDLYKAAGTVFLGPGAFRPLVVEDSDDSWEMKKRSFPRVVGRFTLLPADRGSALSGVRHGVIESVRVIEDGPVRTVVEALFGYRDSFICQRYKLPKTGTMIELESRVYWLESSRMLKLSLPVAMESFRYMGQTAYGVQRLPENGEEAVAQKWTALVSEKRGSVLAVINDGIYGSDFSGRELRLTLLRSPAYASDPDFEQDGETRYTVPQDRFVPRMDQGVRTFRLWIDGGKSSGKRAGLDRAALVKNERLPILSFFPDGGGKPPAALAVLSDEAIQIAAVKKAENGEQVVIRLFEPTGEGRRTVLTLPCLDMEIPLKLEGFEVKTLKIDTQTRRWAEADLLEREHPGIR